MGGEEEVPQRMSEWKEESSIGMHLGYRCTDPQENVAGGHSPASFPKAAVICSAADAITASASQGTPPFPWEKTSAGTPSVLQQLGSHMRLHFQQKKIMHFSLCSMMGAVVPWPGQSAQEPFLSCGCSLCPGVWAPGRERTVEQQHSTCSYLESQSGGKQPSIKGRQIIPQRDLGIGRIFV